MSKNLVLTSIYNLAPDKVEPFFYSLRQSGYTDDIVAFTNQVSAECRAMAAKYHARTIDFESFGLQAAYFSLAKRLAILPKALYRGYLRYPGDVRCLIVNCWRFFGFMNYLSSLRTKPGFVLLADVRDVVFQSQPFIFPQGLSVASEHKLGKIRLSRGNSKWLVEAAGFRELKKLGECIPVCCGTTAADYDTMMTYLAMMTEHLKKRFFWGLFDSVDQGLHNYFVHNNLIKPINLFTNWSGPFLTMDSETVLPDNKDQDGYLCNHDGSIIPIVHQYDRINGLFKKGEPVPPCWKFYIAQS